MQKNYQINATCNTFMKLTCQGKTGTTHQIFYTLVVCGVIYIIQICLAGIRGSVNNISAYRCNKGYLQSRNSIHASIVLLNCQLLVEGESGRNLNAHRSDHSSDKNGT